MRYHVTHRTAYSYASPVTISHSAVRLLPRDLATQAVASHRIECDPTPSLRVRREDYFGNEVEYFTIHEPHTRLVIEATSEVSVVTTPKARTGDNPPWEGVAEEIAGAKDGPTLVASQFRFD
ncbi:MAG: transglutaminase family protein, partial [Armatimonadia bacterium]|nr:transglutaminase family protein [Armatimonadia bacterium]